MTGSRKKGADKRNVYTKLFLLNVTRNWFFMLPPLVFLPCFSLLYASPSQIVNILKGLARKLQTDKLSIKIKWNALIFA